MFPKDPAKLRERVQVMELQKEGTVWSWQPVAETWAQVKVDGKKNLFSTVGIGARNAALVLRARDIDLHNAILWKGQHLFLTSIILQDNRRYIDVQAALVQPVTCTAQERNFDRGTLGQAVEKKGETITFPACLTEKYVGYEDMDGRYAQAPITYVLVTPKAIEMHVGQIVHMDGKAMSVMKCHVMDEWKNEYEVMKNGDV